MNIKEIKNTVNWLIAFCITLSTIFFACLFAYLVEGSPSFIVIALMSLLLLVVNVRRCKRWRNILRRKGYYIE